MALFYIVVALSAFLLFLVQPIIAKQILPWFGGSAAVWTTSLVFFQTALLAGYFYADLGTRKLSVAKLSKVHIAFALLSLLLLPIIPGASWRPSGEEAPMLRILLLLVAVIGVPYVLLSTTSPLVQSWFARTYPGRDPYRLFAVSNAASLLALIGYPFLLEPNAGTHMQALIWSGLFVVFVIALCILAFKMGKSAPQVLVNVASEAAGSEGVIPAAQISGFTGLAKPDVLAWLGLSATGAMLLISVTNHLSHNIPSVPLMWIIPLTIYLFTFILTFDGRGWYARVAFVGPSVAAIGIMGWLLIDKDYQFDLPVHAVIFSIGLFVGCMVCHGELVAAKPPAAQLTRFYLCVSVGGAIGSALVGVLAPLVLPGFYEMAISLVCLALVVLWMSHRFGRTEMQFAAVCVVGGALALSYLQVTRDRENTLSASRNFYGALKVKAYGTEDEDDYFLRLVHGAILHGEQYTSDKWRDKPTTYYTPTSGLGLITTAKLAEKAGLQLGMIGLGVGTYAAYGREGDRIRFYEIDPEVVRVAEDDFYFLEESAARIEIALGDARLNLEREKPQQFDVLAVDAFSGDSIPTHLITHEAIALYLRHIATDGVVAFHVSNRFLDLPPVLEALARAHALAAVMIEDPAQEDNGLHSSSTWVLIARNNDAFKALAGKVAALPIQPSWRIWTDDYNNLVQVLKNPK